MTTKEKAIELIKKYGFKDTDNMYAYNPSEDVYLDDFRCIICMYYDKENDELSILIDDSNRNTTYFTTIEDELFLDIINEDN